MTGFLLDLLLIAALAFCVWQGLRKGLILTVAGVLVIFISAFLAGRVADAYAQPVSEKLYPIMSWLADDAIDEASRGKGRVNEMTDRKEIAEVAQRTFESLGISGLEIDAMVDRVLAALIGAEQTVHETIGQTVLYMAAYALLCLFAFILFMVGFTLLIHFLAAVFKLPVLNLIDKVGGAAAGAFYGILILCAVGWAVRYLGIIAGPELVEDTTILKLFVNHNMLAGLLSFKPESIL
ncbi:MAG: hypothetical protein LBI19_03025 [Oscillospiraceae bacterium]|jgi:uncharacterized membrane protein required for colicin V production|nr:hypothetical protein [Oscillospiraceae bacterium]